MIGFPLVFLAGLIPAIVWTKDFVTERFGLRYWGPLLIAITLFLWGRATIAWDFSVPPLISHNSWEVATVLTLFGFAIRWIEIGKIAKWLVPVLVVIGAVWGLNAMYESGNPELEERAINIAFVSLVVVIGFWVLFIERPKLKKKKAEAAKKSGGGGGGHH